MADHTTCLRCGNQRATPEACSYCGGSPRSLQSRAPTSLMGTTRGRHGGRARPALARRWLCGRCGVALAVAGRTLDGAGRCGVCGASAGEAVRGQNHEGGHVWARVEPEARCGCGRGAWQPLASPHTSATCRACGCAVRVHEGLLRRLVRQAHGAADLGGGDGLHALRALPLGERNPHRDLGLSESVEAVDESRLSEGDEEASAPQLRLRLALGHPRCAGCGGALSLDRRRAQRSAGGLQCARCKARVPSSPWLSALGAMAPLRAILEEHEESEEATHYRAAHGGSTRALWMCFEGPSWQRMQLEQALLRERQPKPQAESQGRGWGFAAAALGGVSLMAAIRPHALVVSEAQADELRAVAGVLALVLVLFGGVVAFGERAPRFKA